jgi:hypothetical protein
MVYTILTSIVFFASFAMMVQGGVWNNLIQSAAIFIAGLVAFGVYQPLTVMADEATGGSYTYLIDLPILCGVFAVTVGVLKQLGQLLSKHRVAYPASIDNFAGAGVGIVGAYLMTGFMMAALHMSPLSRDALSGAYELGDTLPAVKSEAASRAGITRPDLLWLGLTEGMLGDSRWGGAGFSRAAFVHTYAEHRKAFGSIQESIVKR